MLFATTMDRCAVLGPAGLSSGFVGFSNADNAWNFGILFLVGGAVRFWAVLCSGICSGALCCPCGSPFLITMCPGCSPSISCPDSTAGTVPTAWLAFSRVWLGSAHFRDPACSCPAGSPALSTASPSPRSLPLPLCLSPQALWLHAVVPLAGTLLQVGGMSLVFDCPSDSHIRFFHFPYSVSPLKWQWVGLKFLVMAPAMELGHWWCGIAEDAHHVASRRHHHAEGLVFPWAPPSPPQTPHLPQCFSPTNGRRESETLARPASGFGLGGWPRQRALWLWGGSSPRASTPSSSFPSAGAPASGPLTRAPRGPWRKPAWRLHCKIQVSLSLLLVLRGPVPGNGSSVCPWPGRADEGRAYARIPLPEWIVHHCRADRRSPGPVGATTRRLTG